MPKVMTIGRIGLGCGCGGGGGRPADGMSGLLESRGFTGARRRKKRPSGKHCVVSKKGRIFSCYKDAKTARKVARKLGFKVKHR